TTGNLNINTSNVEAWICSGKGLALAVVNNDYNGDSRVTSISAGVTDIGADEFGTVGVSPPLATESAIPAPGTTTTYTLWNRTLCSIDWDAANTTVPTGMNVRYWSGTTVPAPSGNYGAGYLSVTKSGGPDNDTTYNFTLYFGENETYIISTPNSNSRLARYGINEPNPSWQAFVVAGTNKHESELTWLNPTRLNSVKVRGIRFFSDFALTDASAPLPVQLCSFNASVNNRTVNLEWITCSEVNNMGFDIERRQYNPEINNYNEWTKVSFVNGNGTTNEQKIYLYKDNKLVSGKYQYRLKQIDYNGNYEYFDLNSPSEVVIGRPNAAELYQNYPNPSNPNTKVDFQIPFDSKVSLRIFDITGKEVAVLIDKQVDAGFYTSDFNGSNFASGVYFYRLIAESTEGQKFSKTLKMILIK
ncbi:MAG TPA: T9SS type A sorting domain-containing protein, partial [Ignavibacteria bacterium]